MQRLKLQEVAHIFENKLEKWKNLVKDTNLCNRQLYRLLPEREHDAVGYWFLEVEKKSQNAILHAKEHLDKRNEEPPSIITGRVCRREWANYRTPKPTSQPKEPLNFIERLNSSLLKSKEAQEESARRKDEERADQELEE